MVGPTVRSGGREVVLKLDPVQGDSANPGEVARKINIHHIHMYIIYTMHTLHYVTLRYVTLHIYTYVSKSSVCTFIIYVKLKYVEIYIYT